MSATNFSNQNFSHLAVKPWTTHGQLLQPIASFVALPALSLHVHQILTAAFFYYVSYRHALPFLSRQLFSERYPRLPARLKLDWDLSATSMVQSLINSSLAIWLFFITDPQNAMTWGERIWGYQSVTGSALGIATGYFIFHLGEALVHMHIQGSIFVYHGIACLVLCVLGFV